jgi:hypothetical protein
VLDVALALRGRRLADLSFFDSGKAAANEGLLIFIGLSSRSLPCCPISPTIFM